MPRLPASSPRETRQNRYHRRHAKTRRHRKRLDQGRPMLAAIPRLTIRDTPTIPSSRIHHIVLSANKNDSAIFTQDDVRFKGVGKRSRATAVFRFATL